MIDFSSKWPLKAFILFIINALALIAIRGREIMALIGYLFLCLIIFMSADAGSFSFSTNLTFSYFMFVDKIAYG